MTRERVFLQRLLHQHGKPVHALAHCRYSRVPGALSRPLERSAWRDLPALGPRSHDIRVAPGGSKDTPSAGQINGHHSLGRLHKITQNGAATKSSARATGASFARFFCATPNCTRQRNRSPVTIPCLRATPETFAPGCPLSSAIASLCSSLKKRRAGVVGTSFEAAVKLLSAANCLALAVC